MITAGIDLGAQPERTAAASIKWTADRAVIEDVASRADDEGILQMVKQASKTGIDCHSAGRPILSGSWLPITLVSSASPQMDMARAATSRCAGQTSSSTSGCA